MRKRLFIDLATALTFVVWLNIAGSIFAPQFAEASRANEYCATAIFTCPTNGNGCVGCGTLGQTGGCTSYSIFSCTNKPGVCSNSVGCSCNPSAC